MDWIEDIRAVHIKLIVDKVRRGRSIEAAVNPIDVRWEISSDERERSEEEVAAKQRLQATLCAPVGRKHVSNHGPRSA